MNWWEEEKVKNETPEQREESLKRALEEIWKQGRDYTKSSMAWRMAFKARNILKQVYGDKKYDRIS
ncbi:hypothetical protein [Paenibacillus vini]|uniref:Uncharacterized protein n=1 Tax=Paenibacillus vini TaxID=1476024 RepID=A0ABQ4MIX3_9BACL|nr:hypothetical protein [Paenibacillus vini]GIP55940.1 hypothetical protein J42TS3_49750 [Paenibacillus vini]